MERNDYRIACVPLGLGRDWLGLGLTGADEREAVEGKRILVVDDDPGLIRKVSEALRSEGALPSAARDGQEAIDLLRSEPFDLVLLDVLMPRLSGLEVCRRVRAWSQVPIIMLSGLDDQEVKTRILLAGADDYVVKPFSTPELLARIAAVLRRSDRANEPSGEATYTSGDLEVNMATRTTTVGGRLVELTATEFNLLRELISNRGKVLTYRTLLHQVWGPEYGEEREYVRVFINRLRQKLGDDANAPRYIKTEPSIGYRFLGG